MFLDPVLETFIYKWKGSKSYVNVIWNKSKKWTILNYEHPETDESFLLLHQFNKLEEIEKFIEVEVGFLGSFD